MNSLILLAANRGVSNGIAFFKPLYWLFGICMSFLMDILSNQYFVAIIIFTIVTRLLLLPLNIRQQRTMAKTTRLQPKIQKIQKKYTYNGTDPVERRKMQQKQQEETQALYAREGHNPMNMGCGPMVFQMIFLMGIIGIIYYPISYVLGAKDFIDNSQGIYDVILPIFQAMPGNEDAKINYFQLNILENFAAYKEALQAAYPNIFTNELCADIEVYRSGMNLFGLDMTAVPHWKTVNGTFNTLVIIPILCLLTSLASSVVSTLIQKKTNPAAAQQGSQMMMMMLIMPFVSFYISFQVTAAVGFYWIISNLVAIAQQIYIAFRFPPRRAQARNMVENTIERRSREENIKKIK